jgi:hypothetical protein
MEMEPNSPTLGPTADVEKGGSPVTDSDSPIAEIREVRGF